VSSLCGREMSGIAVVRRYRRGSGGGMRTANRGMFSRFLAKAIPNPSWIISGN